jgi:hypothetical protein
LPRARARLASLRWDGWLLSAVVLGIGLRLFHVVSADFPLNDGGLFYMMIEMLRANDYRLPDTIPWAQFEIPFAYPPLAFYVAAIAVDVSPISTIDMLRILPFAGSATVVIAFAVFARSLLSNRLAAVIAVLLFAVFPGGFGWAIAGGGITRTLGQVFALLALRQLVLQFRHPRSRHMIGAVICSALTALSHPESALLLAVSAPLLMLSYGRTFAGFRSVLLVGTGTLLFTSPWWLAMLRRYGIETYTGAGSTSNGVEFAVLGSSAGGAESAALVGLLCILLVTVAWLASRRLFLAAWLVVVLLLSRNSLMYPAPPAAMLLGLGFSRLLSPLLRNAHVALTLNRLLPDPFSRNAAGFMLVLAILGVALYSPLVSLQAPMPILPKEERQAMAWIAANTPSAAAFLVLTTRPERSTVDPTGDWFAALSGRVGLAPPQGTEWLGRFQAVEQSYAALQRCRSLDSDCLERWAGEQGLAFEYVYVPAAVPQSDEKASTRQSCCYPLLASLVTDPDYRLVFEGTGASVFERTALGRHEYSHTVLGP